MQKPILSILASLLLTFCANAQNYEPIELAQKIFVTGHFNSFMKYTKNEYRENKGHPNLNDFNPNLTKTFTLLTQTNDKAVVAMTITDSLHQGIDTYLHFEKDSIWKMVAFRGLALTGMVESERNELRKMTPEEGESILTLAKKKPDFPHFFKTREDYEFELGNTSLWIALDDSIIAHFQKNREAFENLKDSAYSLIQKGIDTKQLEKQYRKMFITAIKENDEDFTNSLHFVIGGITDNVVGYVFIKNEKDVPAMSPDGIIMIKPIGNDWYIYKTT